MFFIVMLLLLNVATAFPGNGVNLQPSYYNNGNVTFGWDLMKKYPSITSVRIEIEPGMETQGKSWIQQAHDNGYQVIATYHNYKVLGSNNENDLVAAGDWWAKNFNYLKPSGSNGHDFFINLINEWGDHDLSVASYTSALNKALAKVRTSGYTDHIVVDIPGWGQETRVAAQASSGITDSKIIFSVHAYPQAYNQAAGHALATSDLDELKNSGRPCIIGEFGTEGSGSVNVLDLVDHAKNIGFWNVMAWAWNGDGGNPDFNMLSPAWYQNPTSTTYKETNYFFKVINSLSSGSQSCTDVYPYADGYTCAQHAAWGKCKESFMQSPSCDKSCGRC